MAASKVSATLAPVKSKKSRVTPGVDLRPRLEPQPELERAGELGDAPRRRHAGRSAASISSTA